MQGVSDHQRLLERGGSWRRAQRFAPGKYLVFFVASNYRQHPLLSGSVWVRRRFRFAPQGSGGCSGASLS
jgi:hypothetical protein